MRHWLYTIIAVIRPSWRPAEATLRESLEIGWDAGVIRPWVIKAIRAVRWLLALGNVKSCVSGRRG